MGFYHGSSQPPEGDEGPASWRETFLIIFAVFRALALPLGILVGVIAYLVFMFWMFSIHVLLGLACIGVVLAAIAVFAVWEARHPPDLTRLERP